MNRYWLGARDDNDESIRKFNQHVQVVLYSPDGCIFLGVFKSRINFYDLAQSLPLGAWMTSMGQKMRDLH
jgi:hypothetical protein